MTKKYFCMLKVIRESLIHIPSHTKIRHEHNSIIFYLALPTLLVHHYKLPLPASTSVLAVGRRRGSVARGLFVNGKLRFVVHACFIGAGTSQLSCLYGFLDVFRLIPTI